MSLIEAPVRPAIRKDKWETRLDEFHSLEVGWDSYDAEPPNGESIEAARAFVNFLRNEDREPDVLNPSSVGGVGFTFQNGKRSVYVEFRNTGNAHAAFMGEGKPRIEKVGLSPAGFREVMERAEAHLDEQDATAARGHEKE